MKKTMKLWTFLLCMVMLFTAVPLQGFLIEAAGVTTAAGTAGGDQSSNESASTKGNGAAATAVADTDVVKVEHDGNETGYATLQDAFDGFAPGNNTYGGKYVITLLGDTAGAVNKSLQYPTEVLDITLDLNGHTLTGTSDASVVNINFGNKSAVGSTFTIKDSSGNNSGKITGGKQGVYFMGSGCTLNFQGGTITGNHGATTGGGIYTGGNCYLNISGGVITGNSVTGTSSGNTGLGGGVYGCYINVTGGTIYGNSANGGSGNYTGRGGGVCTMITGTAGYHVVNIADGTVYGNYAENAGDDLMIQKNSSNSGKQTVTIGGDYWYIDGMNGQNQTSTLTDRYSAENPVAYTDGGWGSGTKKAIGLKYVAPPAYVARLESTGEEFMTLQEALDAANALMVDADNESQTVTLLSNTTESVSLTWFPKSGTANNFKLTIDLNGYTVTGDGTKSVMTFSRSGSYAAKYSMNITINDSSDAKTGTVTGGNTTSGGAIKMDGNQFKANDSLVINGGNFVNNTASSSGGAIYASSTSLGIVINGGTFTGNQAASGGAIFACDVTINGGVITGNIANGEATYTGRGGAICMWGSVALKLNVTGGQIYGNTASRYGDDIVFCSTNKTTASMSLLNAADMNVAGVSGWYVDGYSGAFGSEAGMTDRYGANDVYTEFTDYADFSGSEAKGIVAALKAGEEPVVAPAAPDKFGKNVTPDLVRIICDSDPAHAPINVAWQHQSTKVYPGAEVVWNEELGTWTIDIRIDSISVYYVWFNFEDVYNEISHELVPDAPIPEGKYNIDTTLKWDAEQQLWVTMDEKPIDVHVSCKTQPTAPSDLTINKYQIKVTGIVDGEEKVYYIYVDPSNATVGPIKGNREEGFTVDVTVKISEDDTLQAGWIAKRDPDATVEDYDYDWSKTPETITITLVYTGTLDGNLTDDWALSTTGKTSGTIGEAYVLPAKPDAPDKYGKNVTPALVRVICDSDPNHAPIDIKWQHQSTKVYPGAEVVWNEELRTWTVDIRIDGISTYYVWLNFEEVYNEISHDLVPNAPLPEGKYNIDTTLKWDVEQQLWVTMDEKPIDVHVSCKTAPTAPSYIQLKSYQIKVWGDVNGDLKTYTTSIPEEYYTISDVYGNREEGFFVDVTVTLTEGDIFQSNWIAKRNPGYFYNYDWDKTEKTVTFTLRYNDTLDGNLTGDGSGDWVLDTTGKTFGVVSEAYLKQITCTVNLVIYRNGNTTTPYKTASLGQIAKGATLDLSTLDISEYYTSRYGFEMVAGYFNDGGWNQYKAGRNPAGLDEIYINGWTNIICMVYDYQPVNLVIYRNGNTTTPYATVNLGKELMGSTLGLTAINVADHYSSANGFEVVAGLYNDGAWNQYKAGKNPAGLREIKINGWTNVICMVYDYQTLVIHGVINGEKASAETIYTGTILYGENLISWLDANVTLPEKPGYTVNTWWNWDWYGHKFDDSKTVNGWTNVYVDYQANKYTLTLDPNGGKVDPSTITVTFNGAVGTLPVPTKEGYTFVGWMDANGTKVLAETIYTLVGDSTLTASWSANTYAITLDAQGGEVDPAAVNVVFNQAVNTLPVPTKEGYTFAGWFDAEGNAYTAETVYTVAADITLIAKWTANTYTITLDDGSEETTSKDVTFDAPVGELPVPTKEGYTFAGWVDAEGNAVTAETVYTIAGDSTLTATWTANEYTLTLDAGNGTTETVKVTYGEVIGELPVPTKEGYTFEGWIDAEGNLVTEETVYTFASDAVCTASWKAVENEPVTPPATGDSLVISAVLFTMVICAAGIVLILKNRKKYFCK